MFATKGDLIFTIIVITITYCILTGFIILIAYNFYKAKASKAKEILSAIFQTQENERTRIAEDLHDDIGGKLSYLKIQNELVLKNALSPAVIDIANKSTSLINKIVNDIRVISRNQASKFIVDNGLKNELEELICHTSAYNIKINFEYEIENSFKLKSDFEVNLFRIFQELIHNSVKHAACSGISIRISQANDKLDVYYADNGSGYTKTDKINSSMGIKNIYARIKLFDGNYKFISIPGKETGYTIIFKLDKVIKS